jgi:hypothetical protein
MVVRRSRTHTSQQVHAALFPTGQTFTLGVALVLSACIARTPSHSSISEVTPVGTQPAAGLREGHEPVAASRQFEWVVSHPSPPTPLRHDTIDVNAWRLQVGRPSPLQVYRQHPLNETRRDWAIFLIGVHDRLHPVFAEEYLASLSALPADLPENAPTLSVQVGLVIAQATGEISELYIGRSSGVFEFDAAALSAFLRIFPMPVPAQLASEDGRVYFEWELHRNSEACSTFDARPYRFGPR